MTDKVQYDATSIARNQDFNTYSRTLEEVQRDFQQVDPSSINAACNEWSSLAKNLGTLTDDIQSIGGPLADVWESTASAGAQQQLQVAAGTAQAMAAASMHMARATDYASKYASWYASHIPGAGLIHTGADDQAAVDHMVKLIDRYNEVIAYNLPAEVRAQYVDANADGGYDHFKKTGVGSAGNTSASGVGGGAGGVSAGDAGSVPGGTGDTRIPHLTGAGSGHLPGSGTGSGTLPGSGVGVASSSPYDPGSALAGGGAAGGIGTSGGLGGATAGIGGVSGAGATGTGSAGGFGAGVTGTGSAGGFGGSAGTVGAGGLPGSSPAGGRAGGTGTGSGTGSGAGNAASRRGMVPMHGTHGQDEQERERSTWLTEDEDVWGTDNDAPPPVIGG